MFGVPTGAAAKGFQDSAVQSACGQEEPAAELETDLAVLDVAEGGDKAAAPPASPYPEFPETNPFRLPETGARRSGSALVAQRAVGVESDPSGGGRLASLERRDSIWDRLPPPDLEQRRLSDQEGGASAATRLLRSPFTLGQATPTPDQTNDEGRDLFLEFVRDRIEEDIQVDELALQAQNDDYFNRIMALPGLSNPVWAQTGTELRALADAFATSHQRQELRCKALQTDLTGISWDRFRQLLEELFSGEAGVTQERILVLFFFLSDCVVATIRRHAWTHLRRLIEWSLRYIVERVCALVQQAGGWGVVLRTSAEYVYMALKMATCGLVCVAAIMYIRKSLN
ncbi:uncharacterized protein LOC119100168 [Pollicipes pollicipes]|uniref:uncharacterized protein LOC119100168 n=1 Tax=Pollicipes pollicipes TaxID=41117 RepID=UPI0018854497|nr:uncharacterized protein LOC119100168 [Pollicipes pollicipes]